MAEIHQATRVVNGRCATSQRDKRLLQCLTSHQGQLESARSIYDLRVGRASRPASLLHHSPQSVIRKANAAHCSIVDSQHLSFVVPSVLVQRVVSQLAM